MYFCVKEVYIEIIFEKMVDCDGEKEMMIFLMIMVFYNYINMIVGNR